MQPLRTLELASLLQVHLLQFQLEQQKYYLILQIFVYHVGKGHRYQPQQKDINTRIHTVETCHPHVKALRAHLALPEVKSERSRRSRIYNSSSYHHVVKGLNYSIAKYKNLCT